MPSCTSLLDLSQLQDIESKRTFDFGLWAEMENDIFGSKETGKETIIKRKYVIPLFIMSSLLGAAVSRETGPSRQIGSRAAGVQRSE